MEQLDALTLPMNTDVVEWCPAAAPPAARCLAVGTYQLDEATGQRAGRLHLFVLDAPTDKLRLLAAVDLPGVFDIRWRPAAAAGVSPAAAAPPLLAAALADGSVRLYAVTLTAEGAAAGQLEAGSLEEVYSTGAPPEAALAVSLDYARCRGDEGAALAVSYSDGSLQHFQVRKGKAACEGGSLAEAALDLLLEELCSVLACSPLPATSNKH